MLNYKEQMSQKVGGGDLKPLAETVLIITVHSVFHVQRAIFVSFEHYGYAHCIRTVILIIWVKIPQ